MTNTTLTSKQIHEQVAILAAKQVTATETEREALQVGINTLLSLTPADERYFDISTGLSALVRENATEGGTVHLGADLINYYSSEAKVYGYKVAAQLTLNDVENLISEYRCNILANRTMSADEQMVSNAEAFDALQMLRAFLVPLRNQARD